jgi:hypothetical protein
MGKLMQRDNEQTPDEDRTKARRAFLAKCGRFAAITGPAVALMLTVSNKSEAAAEQLVSSAKVVD